MLWTQFWIFSSIFLIFLKHPSFFCWIFVFWRSFLVASKTADIEKIGIFEHNSEFRSINTNTEKKRSGKYAILKNVNYSPNTIHKIVFCRFWNFENLSEGDLSGDLSDWSDKAPHCNFSSLLFGNVNLIKISAGTCEILIRKLLMYHYLVGGKT